MCDKEKNGVKIGQNGRTDKDSMNYDERLGAKIYIFQFAECVK